MTKARKPVPKAGGVVKGHLQVTYVTCGTPGCRCTRGRLHGPYTRLAHWEAGRVRREYVPLALVEETRLALARWRAARTQVQAARRDVRMLNAALRGYRDLERRQRGEDGER